MVDAAPQIDPKVMASLQKKIAQVQQILGLFVIVETLIGLLMLAAPLWLAASGLTPSASEGFPYMALAPFLFALAFGANMAKKDLTHAKVVFRTTAISGLGFAVITILGIFVFALPGAFWVLAAIALIIGALAQFVINQFNKMAG